MIVGSHISSTRVPPTVYWMLSVSGLCFWRCLEWIVNTHKRVRYFEVWSKLNQNEGLVNASYKAQTILDSVSECQAGIDTSPIVGMVSFTTFWLVIEKVPPEALFAIILSLDSTSLWHYTVWCGTPLHVLCTIRSTKMGEKKHQNEHIRLHRHKFNCRWIIFLLPMIESVIEQSIWWDSEELESAAKQNISAVQFSLVTPLQLRQSC